jgi:hypothetical protein
MQQIVKVTVKDGVPTIMVQGCKGKTCKDITRELEKALGDTKDSKPTGEMFEHAQQATKASR